jgi:hypothetical protein
MPQPSRGDQLRAAAAKVEDMDPELAGRAREISALLDDLDLALVTAFRPRDRRRGPRHPTGVGPRRV